MKHLDWDQEAGLTRATFIHVPQIGLVPVGEDVAQGTLDEMVSRYLEIPEEEQLMMAITIAGGFHVDGPEIAALADLRRRQRDTPWDS